MWKIFAGTTVMFALSTWYLWTTNQVLVENNLKLESAVATQEAAIQSLQNDFTLQTGQLNELQKKSQEAQLEMNRYLDIFRRHNLSKLAAAKPGLIEPKVNKATKEVFDGIEQDSRDIDDADDGLTMQPTPTEEVRG
jgi:hypothetical protein